MNATQQTAGAVWPASARRSGSPDKKPCVATWLMEEKSLFESLQGRNATEGGGWRLHLDGRREHGVAAGCVVRTRVQAGDCRGEAGVVLQVGEP